MALKSTLLSFVFLIISSQLISCQPTPCGNMLIICDETTNPSCCTGGCCELLNLYKHELALRSAILPDNKPLALPLSLPLPLPCTVGFVNCIVAPCLRSACSAYPNAICTDNYCGGCNAVFMDQNGNQLTPAICSGAPPPLTTTTTTTTTTTQSQSQSTAETPIMILPTPTPTTPAPTPRTPQPKPLPFPSPFCAMGWVYCSPAPCSISNCPYYPNALCINNYCGQCSADFYDSYNYKLTPQQCGSGSGIQIQDTTTTNSPTKTTILTTITPPSPSPSPSPSSICLSGWIHCDVTPCSVSNCPSYPNAICKDNYCGECHADWYDQNSNKLTDEECGVVPAPLGPFCALGWLSCSPAPCDASSCPQYPQATCFNNYCGQCAAVWSDQNGNILTQQQCSQPPPPQIQLPTSSPSQIIIASVPSPSCSLGWISCSPAPCDASICPPYPHAICTNNYCGYCSAIWSDHNGNILTPQQCSPTPPITTHKPTSNPTKTPTSNPTKTPTSNPIKMQTLNPIKTPTSNPTKTPTSNPTKTPTSNPIKMQTLNPTKTPTSNPIKTPTSNPIKMQTLNPIKTPTSNPIKTPTSNPIKMQTSNPTKTPTSNPIKTPTSNPIKVPTSNPIFSPTSNPSLSPIPIAIAIKSPSASPVFASTALCVKSGVSCTDGDICCGGGVAECLFETLDSVTGRCCIKHRKKGCVIDEDCCRFGIDGICSAAGKCKRDKNILVAPAAAARNVENKFDNFEVIKDGGLPGHGHSYMTLSIYTLSIVLVIILVIIPISYYCYYQKCILKKIKKSVPREVFHGLEISAHSDDDTPYVD